jgi:hypothetical protein
MLLPPPALESGLTADGVMWFDNLFPIRVHKWDFRHLFSSPKSALRRLDNLVHKMASSDVHITQMIPKQKEGGAFIYFNSATHDESTIASKLTKFLSANNQRVMFNIEEIRCHVVEGKPFINDLSGYPSKKVRVDFIGGPKDVTLENLYSMLRRYGKIVNIEYFGGQKDVTRYAVAEFKHFHGAVGSKNCAHGQFINGTRLEFSYQEMLKTGFVFLLLFRVYIR